jgi:ABC-type sugar transport system permease subunit
LKIKYALREALTGYAFISIWIFGFLLFTMFPLLRTLWFSLNDVKITAVGIETSFAGLKNFQDAFLLDVAFAETLVDYLFQLVVLVPIIIVFSIIVALLLNLKIKGKGFLRTVYFLPVIITSGPVIQKLIDEGATTFPGLEQFIELSALQETFPTPVARVISFLISSFIIILWFSGVQILIFLAGLQKLDKGMYEAADIDGASKWESFWKITLPALNSLIAVNIVYTIVTYSIFALNPIIGLISQSMYATGKGFGYASALAWIYFAVLLVVLGLFTFVIIRKEKRLTN